MHILLHSLSPPCSIPPPTHASAGDSWTVPGKSGSVSCGITASFSWVLVCTRFCLCPLRVYFPVLCKFWQLYSGVNGDLLQEGLCHTQVCCKSEPLSLWQSTADLFLPRKCSNTVLFHSLWGLCVLVHTRCIWALWACLVGMGFDSKCKFTPPTIFVGLLLCPWKWSISSQPLQHHAAAIPVPHVFLGLLWP